MRSDSDAGRQKKSSPSEPGSLHVPSFATSAQYSQRPISSENATLYECAAHGTRVCSPDVAYIGWNAYCSSEQVDACGWKSGCANPFPTLAVIEPVSPVVRSFTVVTSPSGESWIEIESSSPAFMNTTFEGSGVNVAAVKWSGSGRACGTPVLVRNAKFAHSSPAEFRQAALFV